MNGSPGASGGPNADPVDASGLDAQLHASLVRSLRPVDAPSAER